MKYVPEPLTPPKGFDEICELFGDPRCYLHNLKEWERRYLTLVSLDEPLPYAYAPPARVSSVTVHKRLAHMVARLLAETVRLAHKYPVDRWAFGGCYTFRTKRSSTKLSTHAWGIAVDLGPKRNPLGVAWSPKTGLPVEVVSLWKAAGFTWGGDWRVPDPMHFQYARGY